ncbi:MAG: hypothetical protein HY791_06930 [Deltaproteobacteria bacterium]|nr:hypothetical protein [Deltaproteobacteria bacterium]
MKVVGRMNGPVTGVVTEKIPVGQLQLASSRRAALRTPPLRRLEALPIPTPPFRRTSSFGKLPISARAARETARVQTPAGGALLGATPRGVVSGATLAAASRRNPIHIAKVSAPSALASAVTKALEGALHAEPKQLEDLADKLNPGEQLSLVASLSKSEHNLVVDLHLAEPDTGRVVAAASFPCREASSQLPDVARDLIRRLVAKAKVTL